MKLVSAAPKILCITALLFLSLADGIHAGCSDKKYLEAEKIYRKAVQTSSPQEKIDLLELAFATCPSHGNHADGYYKLGKLYYDRQEKEKAFEWLLQANRFKGALVEESSDDLADANLLLSNVYKARGNTELALVHLNIYRALKKKGDKGLEQSLIENAEDFFSVIYSAETAKDTLAVEKSVAPQDRAKLNRLEVYFDSAKSSLDDDAKKRLDSIGDALRSEDFSGNSIVVEGHTDEAGGEQYNCRLGAERATAVVEYLENIRGVTALKMFPVSYGKTSPVISRHSQTRPDWPKIDRYNRRVVILNLGPVGASEKDIRVEGLVPDSPCAAPNSNGQKR